uniref:Myosin motor domain-containing protein n=1 Tax=Rhabditophanes sp. KR3021 TaxID=114890 RepID=A0AC35U8D7_9BILA
MPIYLKAFGNAKTMKNDNSSRFGKYIDVHFNLAGVIEGAKIQQYLLEKSRIVTQTVEERNYHIFYSLLAGLTKDEKDLLSLSNAEDYFYLNQGRTYTIEGRNEPSSLNEIKAAMKVLMFKDTEIWALFKILGSLLHIGNISYHISTFSNIETVEINDGTGLGIIGNLLQIDTNDLSIGLTTKTLIMRNEKVVSGLSAIQALNVRDALVKGLYGRIFVYIINKINEAIYRPKKDILHPNKNRSIGILDIFGFENFQTNSFEQLCINFANEHLQQFFVQHVFKLEQMEYDLEQINWRKIEFIDNQSALDLLAERPLSIMALINEESIFPKGTDQTMLSKLHMTHGKNDLLYVKPRSDLNKSFGVKHYAGTVIYSVKGFLEKNRDTFGIDLLNLISKSKFKFMKNLFEEIHFPETASSKMQTTVGSQFKKSLETLMCQLSKCEPYFIRCIKPNDFKQPMTFDRDLVFRQLRYSGMMETIRIRKAGYPIRYSYEAFVERFRLVLQTVKEKQKVDIVMASQAICEKALGIKADYQLGKTKIFLKEHDETILEKHNDSLMNHYATIIQKTIKGFRQKRKFGKERAAAIMIQKNWKGYQQRKKYKTIILGISRIQAMLRSKILVKHYQNQRNVIIKLQAACRAYLHKKNRAMYLRENAKMMAHEEEENHYYKIDNTQDFDESNIVDQIFGEAISTEDMVTESVSSIVEAPPNFSDEDLSSYQFKKFAATYFTPSISGSFYDGHLKTSLLQHDSPADVVASMAIWTMILRFMGDAKEPKAKEVVYDSVPTVVPVMTQVYNTIQRNIRNKKPLASNRASLLSETSSFSSSKRGIENIGRKLISMTLRKKSKITNILPSDNVSGQLPHSAMSNPFEQFGYDNIIENQCKSNMDKLHFIIGHAILKASLRDEIYCQICKQLSDNPNINSVARGWILLSLCVGCFGPSPKLVKYLYCFIRSNGMVNRINYGEFIEERLNRTIANGFRLQPPSYVELQACKTKKNIVLAITFMDGNVRTLNADSATTSKELCAALKERMGIDDGFGFAIYIALFDKVTSLGCGSDHVMDAISQCEQYAKENGRPEKNAPWRLFFRKEVFSPWYNAKEDEIGTELIYHQIIRGIKHGEYRTEKEEELASVIARQFYVESDGHSVNVENIEKEIDKMMPDYFGGTYDKEKWLQMILHAYRKFFYSKYGPEKSVRDVKASVVESAKFEWPLLFSRFYEGYKFTGPQIPKNEVIIAVNWTGFYIVDDQEQVLLEFSYPEIAKITSIGTSPNSSNDGSLNVVMNHCFTIKTIDNNEFTFQSPNSDDIRELVTYFLKGLKDRSIYMISKANLTDSKYVECVKGDLLTLVDDITGEHLSKRQFVLVENERTGLQGNVPVDNIYVLPSLVKPTMSILNTFASDDSICNDHGDTNQMILFTPNEFSDPFKHHDLDKFSKSNFKAQFNSQRVCLYKYSREMIKHPLLKKVENRPEPSNEAVKSYMAIMQFMGDYPLDISTNPAEITDFIFGAALKYEILRDETYCQIMKQLTNNCNQYSMERGWELLWLCCGLFPPSTMFQKEIFSFLRSRMIPIAIDCTNRLQRALKAGFRKFPPHQVEVSAVQHKTTQIYHKAFFPDGSHEAIEVESMSRARDFCDRIVKRLGLHSADGYSLFVKIGERVLSVPENEFFFDFIRQLYEWIKQNKYSLMLNNAKATKDSDKTDTYQVYFMRKLWINVVPGEDKNADLIFHYHQELPKYLRGYHVVNKNEAATIAAILLRAQTRADCEPPFNQFNHVVGDVIPKDLVKLVTTSEWKKLITSEYQNLSVKTPEDAKILFLKTVCQWPTFGSAFFEVKQTSDPALPEKLLIAINQGGVNLYNSHTKEHITTYPFSQISNWTMGNTYFTLSVGGIMKGSRVLWETTLGYKMDDLLTSYIRCLISNNEENQSAAISGI